MALLEFSAMVPESLHILNLLLGLLSHPSNMPFLWIRCAVYSLFQGNEMTHTESVPRKSCQVREGDIY